MKAKRSMQKEDIPAAVVETVVAEVEIIEEGIFHISATGAATKPRHTLKYDDTFVVVDSAGDIGASAGGSDGLFYNDTRFLSRLELLINDHPPLSLGVSARDDNILLSVDLTNPEIREGSNLVLTQDSLHIVRTIYLWQRRIYQRLAVRNYGGTAVDVSLTVIFGNDFADLFEVRGAKRKKRGTTTAARVSESRVVLTYRGLDATERQTNLSFDPAPTALTTSSARFDMHLEVGEYKPLFCVAECDHADDIRPNRFLRALKGIHRERVTAYPESATVETSNEVINEILRRSMADLHMLMTRTPQGPYPYAGIPWYSTTFGRDGLITALQMLWFDASIARGVLRRLAHYQATTDDPAADAQPGKILHEMRGGEMAALGEVPFRQYYGSVDATPLFVLVAGLYAERTGDDATLAELWPNIEAALHWIDGHGDPDHDGFVEYRRATDLGLANQGWKDSFDAVFHADGQLAEGHIALAEVQGYVYAAKKTLSRCAHRLGKTAQATRLDAQADALAERFEASFWCPEIGTYAIALDGKKRPCRVRTSNAGQLLFTGIVSQEHAEIVAAGLMRPQFFTGWGIRTVAKGEARYNPMSYHNGSIWPHDNALIGLGFARYGLTGAVERLFKGLMDTAAYMNLRRLPELFCGFQRQPRRGPTLYPVACSPQAWASATPFTMIEAALGLEFDPGNRSIRLRNPRLPRQLDEVRLHNLRLGEASVDLTIRRHGENVSIDVPRSAGKVSVVLSG